MSQDLLTKSRIEILQDRAEQMAQVRSFFKKRNVLEVDCPSLTKYASVDAHIDLIPAFCFNEEKRYLFSSPEYGMKRLLSEGIGDIYQLSHVFRNGERGSKHQPEFMMIEWYRIGFSFEKMIQETAQVVNLFLPDLKFRSISYREAFQTYVDLDPFITPVSVWQKLLDSSETDLDNLLNLALALHIEPHLGKEEITALTYYPGTQSSLAKKIVQDGFSVAERFELYVQGVELANGYHELIDAKEQRMRFLLANEERKKLGKEELPIDIYFLEALEKGIPSCSGVAVGFDRLMMLRHKKEKIEDTLPFSWEFS